jgi:hypothetical protein
MNDFNIHRFLDLAGGVKIDDLDWDLCARIGVSDAEARILRYMGDTESHTILYMRDLLAGHSTRDPDVVNFLSAWVYEELCHGRAITKLLDVCGRPESPTHYTQTTESASVREFIEAALSHALAYATPRFVAVHMTWGAINEATAAAAYQNLEKRTAKLQRQVAKRAEEVRRNALRLEFHPPPGEFHPPPGEMRRNPFWDGCQSCPTGQVVVLLSGGAFSSS